MKNLIQLSFIGALTLFSAVQAAEIDKVTVTPDKKEMAAQHRYPMRQDEFYKFKRTYELSNGMTLSLFNQGNLMYAKLNDQQSERIIANSGSAFSSTKSALKMHIDVMENGEVSGEVFIPVTSVATNNSEGQMAIISAIQ